MNKKIAEFIDPSISDQSIRAKYFPNRTGGRYLPGDARGWSLTEKRKVLAERFNRTQIIQILYRPFDIRWTYYSEDILDWPRTEISDQFLKGPNLAILFPRQLANLPYDHALVTNSISEMCAISNRTKEQNTVFPLYIYPEEGELDQVRRVNLDPKLYKQMRKAAGLSEESDQAAEAIFDYIYGVLHCPAYRDTYAEFLKIDFPRIPWPTSPAVFRDLSSKGNALRRLHLMEPTTIGEARYPLRGEGDLMVEKGYPKFESGADGMGEVFINEHQRFTGAPEVSWDFWIGGYQPAQKWLKDRRGRQLSTDDLIHYQRILKILSETDRVMQTIEMDL